MANGAYALSQVLFYVASLYLVFYIGQLFGKRKLSEGVGKCPPCQPIEYRFLPRNDQEYDSLPSTAREALDGLTSYPEFMQL